MLTIKWRLDNVTLNKCPVNNGCVSKSLVIKWCAIKCLVIKFGVNVAVTKCRLNKCCSSQVSCK